MKIEIHHYFHNVEDETLLQINKQLTKIGKSQEEILKQMAKNKADAVAAFGEFKDALTAEIGQLDAKFDALQAKIDELEAGEDLTDLVDDIKATTDRVKNIVADAPTPEPTVEPTTEPTPEDNSGNV
jgi:DNA-binding transcriptional MerR regulator